MIEAAVLPWLHLGVIIGALLLFIAACAQANDRESACALAVVGILILIAVAAEHGVLAYFRR